MRRSLIAAIAAASLAAAPATLAQQDDAAPERESPGELAAEGMEKLMLALELLIRSIPQYELPEMLDNGDIIIRRVPEGGERTIPAPDEEDDDAPVETLRPEQEET